jgi:hypothetical protein
MTAFWNIALCIVVEVDQCQGNHRPVDGGSMHL